MWECNKIRAISFDCGGTLYYEVEEDYVVFHRILQRLGYGFEVAEVKKALDKARFWWDSEKKRTGRVWNENCWVSLLQRMVSNLAIPNPHSIAIGLHDYWLSGAQFKAYEDVVPTLKALKNRGFKLIVISNVSSGKNLKIYMQKAEIPDCFDALIASGDVGYEKPNPEIFKIASKLSNTPLKSILHIGDKYEEDYLGASNTGLKSLLIDRKEAHKDKQCPKIKTLTELFRFL
jgi:putative hydrolase of the HAD superfamily